jgi:Erv1 / Alr family
MQRGIDVIVSVAESHPQALQPALEPNTFIRLSAEPDTGKVFEERTMVFVTHPKQEPIDTQNHWDKLHRMPIELDTWNTQEAMGWFMRWNADIPHINCSCRSDWSELISQHPIEISTRLSFAIWCWHRHNDVNAKLRETQGGHPHFEWSDCCDLHGYPEDWKSAELDQPHQLSTSSGLCSDCS